METNLTNRKRTLSTANAATTWQPCAGLRRGVALSVNGMGSLPTYFIGGGLVQRQAQSIESLGLSDSRHSQI
jgi:hypothetical protein